ncbi:MAG: hypothetical protein L3J26_09665 [Candidatus Polarisedimenticolaceae bacterium]|nr:hypothetical protein [Candidatus Polarisedimenticolaceae bacterium]
MSPLSLRHLHMGCGEPLVATWFVFNSVNSKAKQKRVLPSEAKLSNQRSKDKGAC